MAALAKINSPPSKTAFIPEGTNPTPESSLRMLEINTFPLKQKINRDQEMDLNATDLVILTNSIPKQEESNVTAELP